MYAHVLHSLCALCTSTVIFCILFHKFHWIHCEILGNKFLVSLALQQLIIILGCCYWIFWPIRCENSFRIRPQHNTSLDLIASRFITSLFMRQCYNVRHLNYKYSVPFGEIELIESNGTTERVFDILLHLQHHSFLLVLFFFPLGRDAICFFVRCKKFKYEEVNTKSRGFSGNVRVIGALMQSLTCIFVFFVHGRVKAEAGHLAPVALWARAAHDVGEGKAPVLCYSLKVEELGEEVKQSVEEHARGESAQLFTLPQILFFHSRVHVACTHTLTASEHHVKAGCIIFV